MVVGHDDDHDEQHQQDQGKDHIGQHAQAVIRQDADQGDRRHGQGQDQEDQQNDPRQAQAGGRLREGRAHIAALLLHQLGKLGRQALHIAQEPAQGEGGPGKAKRQHCRIVQGVGIQINPVIPLGLGALLVDLLPELQFEILLAHAVLCGSSAQNLAAGEADSVIGDAHLHPGQKQHGGACQDQHDGDDLHRQRRLGFRGHSITLFPGSSGGA